MIFSVTCDQFNLGATFLIWSTHYLSGNDKYHSIEKNKILQIPNNPLSGGTAHKFIANEITSIKDCHHYLDTQHNTPGHINHIKYYPVVETLREYHSLNKDFQLSMIDRKIPIINMSCKNLQHLIGFLRSDYEQDKWQNDFEIVKKHCKHYWPDILDDAEIYPDNLTTFHGIREAIAFRLRPYDFWEHHKTHNFTDRILTNDFYDLLTNGYKVIKSTMSYLNLQIIDARLEDWSRTQKKWSAELMPYMDFCNDIEHIIDNIVANKKIDLGRYRMDVLKEAVLLHLLIYKHNLNLTISIDKLPNDTQEIYKLLGKNTRSTIKKLY